MQDPVSKVVSRALAAEIDRMLADLPASVREALMREAASRLCTGSEAADQALIASGKSLCMQKLVKIIQGCTTPGPA